RAAARIEMAAPRQFLPRSKIVQPARMLLIGRVRSAHVRTLLPFDSQPAQIGEHGLDKFRAAALPVQVLVAKDHDPVVDPRALVGRPKSARMPEVEISRRGRCNASAIDHRRLVSRLILSWLPAGIVAHSSASRGNKAPRRKGKRAWGRSG